MSLFDKLKERTGIDVDERLLFYPFVITYDIESFLPRKHLLPDTDTMHFVASHELLRVSICSNVPGCEEPEYFVRSTSASECMERFVNRLVEMAEAARDMRQRLHSVLERTKSIVERLEEGEIAFASDKFSSKSLYNLRKDLCGIVDALEAYADRIPVVSFNFKTMILTS